MNDKKYRKQRATELYNELSLLNNEIKTIDEAIAYIQVERANDEAEFKNHEASYLWRIPFDLFRNRDTKSEYKCFLEQRTYRNGTSISLTVPELMFIRGFKESKVKELRKEIEELAIDISRY